MEAGKRQWTWWRAHELRINLIASLLLVLLLLLGIALNSGIIVGPSLLLLIFFGTYSVYAYERRER
jgi:uncharacterized membrane protein